MYIKEIELSVNAYVQNHGLSCFDFFLTIIFPLTLLVIFMAIFLYVQGHALLS